MTTLQLTPCPDALDWPEGVPRHSDDPTLLGRTMDTLAAQRDWAALDWPDVLRAHVALGRADIPLGRLVEGHTDALVILRELGGTPVPHALYAVWASRSRGTGLSGAPVGPAGQWRVSGTLRFASGAGVVDRALVPVWTDGQHQVLLDVPVSSWTGDPASWRTRAMTVSRSWTVPDLDVTTDAVVVGRPDDYLRRPGFHPGGVRVAAVWTGGAARLVDLVQESVAQAPPSATRAVRLGRMRTALTTALAVLDVAGRRIPELLEADPAGLWDLATEVRACVAASCRSVLDDARALAGPAGLALHEDLTRAIDDLELYTRQQPADADLERLGGC